MEPTAEKLARLCVEELDQILGVPFRVLDDGFVRVVDYMGSDASVVQAARVSYGAGTRRVHEDRGLIRYLLRHRHTTPFEMCELKLHVRVPMDCWRQWIRHRMACLAGSTRVYFDVPPDVRERGNQVHTLTIEDIWSRLQPASPYGPRSSLRRMPLRQVNEDSLLLERTRLKDAHRNGVRPVFRMHLADGKWIDCTADHRFLFAGGWKTLREGAGLHESGGRAVWHEGAHEIYVNGAVLESSALHRDKAWLHEQYNVLRKGIPDIARLARVSSPTVRKWLRIHGLQHATGGGTSPRHGVLPGRAGEGQALDDHKPTRARRARIASFEYLGEQETYDLEVEGPYHNFIANGIVTHNSVNEYSTRYSVAIDAAQRTPPGEWRMQSAGNRQGSEGCFPAAAGEALSGQEAELHDRSRRIYDERIQAGVAREQARKDLPLSTYTEAYWKIDLHNLLHFLALRMDAHAQEEIRAYAATIGQEIVRRWCPLTWEAFQDYRFQASQLSRLELEVLGKLTRGDAAGATELARGYGWLEAGPKGLKGNRERKELEEKLAALGLKAPWAE